MHEPDKIIYREIKAECMRNRRVFLINQEKNLIFTRNISYRVRNIKTIQKILFEPFFLIEE